MRPGQKATIPDSDSFSKSCLEIEDDGSFCQPSNSVTDQASEENQDTNQQVDSTERVTPDGAGDEAAASLTEEQLAEIEMMKQMGLPVSFFETNKEKKTKVGLHSYVSFIYKCYFCLTLL